MLKIFLKLTASLFFLLSSLTSHANVRDGLYLGAGLGESFVANELTTTSYSSGLTVNSDGDENNTIGNLFIGYGSTSDSGFFLGGELGTNFPGRTVNMDGIANAAFSPFVVSNRLTITDYVTLDLLPGYAINNGILLYGRAGFSYGQLRYKQVLNNSAFSIETDNNTWGGRIGLGTTIAFSPNFGMALDYYYSAYQEMTVASPLFNMQFKSKPSANFVGISLLYRL